MDFNDTPEEAAFRAEVRAFLDRNADRKTGKRQVFRGRYVADAEALRRAKKGVKKSDDDQTAAVDAAD